MACSRVRGQGNCKLSNLSLLLVLDGAPDQNSRLSAPRRPARHSLTSTQTLAGCTTTCQLSTAARGVANLMAAPWGEILRRGQLEPSSASQ